MSVLPGRKRYVGSRCFNVKDPPFPVHLFTFSTQFRSAYFSSGTVFGIQSRIRTGSGLRELPV